VILCLASIREMVLSAHQTHVNMNKYVIQLLVESDRILNIDLKAIEEASKGEVLSVNPRPIAQQPSQRTAALQARQPQAQA
jgi:hypothetical protein